MNYREELLAKMMLVIAHENDLQSVVIVLANDFFNFIIDNTTMPSHGPLLQSELETWKQHNNNRDITIEQLYELPETVSDAVFSTLCASYLIRHSEIREYTRNINGFFAWDRHYHQFIMK